MDERKQERNMAGSGAVYPASIQLPKSQTPHTIFPQSSTPATADLSNNSGCKEPWNKWSKKPPQPFGEEGSPQMNTSN